jgi:hypothetical protein
LVFTLQIESRVVTDGEQFIAVVDNIGHRWSAGQTDYKHRAAKADGHLGQAAEGKSQTYTEGNYCGWDTGQTGGRSDEDGLRGKNCHKNRESEYPG